MSFKLKPLAFKNRLSECNILTNPNTRRDTNTALVEYLIAFFLILGASSLVCLLGNRLAPKTNNRELGRVQYACGERPLKIPQRMQASLYKYLLYFLIIDSSLLILAYAALDIVYLNPIPLVIYLSTILVAVFLFTDGGEQ
jgi:NADH:ubiquinone oxidoreductase subunit 3 (subunit A)